MTGVLGMPTVMTDIIQPQTQRPSRCHISPVRNCQNCLGPRVEHQVIRLKFVSDHWCHECARRLSEAVLLTVLLAAKALFLANHPIAPHHSEVRHGFCLWMRSHLRQYGKRWRADMVTYSLFKVHILFILTGAP